jgi:hypothetical protein
LQEVIDLSWRFNENGTHSVLELPAQAELGGIADIA